ncbi:flagellar hook-basal body complex protein [bacterium]|nr:flagellar hook-basal body complex protein [bacterium]MBU1995294.1 flagellar hook-basal body complex protein [bacterium]
MMSQAFYTGISGIKSNQIAIDALSDNLANLSTIGYRGYSTEFSSLFENMLSGSNFSSVDSSIGIGSKLQATVMSQQNGSLILAEKNTDLAIDGDGWFGIQGGGETLYTRAGNFTFDVNSDLVTADGGYYVLGTMGKNINGEVLTKKLDSVALGDIATQETLRFPKTLSYPAEPTTKASFYANLGVADEVRVVSASVVDPQSNKNQLKLTFTKATPQNTLGTLWDVVATTQSLDGTIIYDTQSGMVDFDARGALLSTTLTSINNNGASVAINLGTEFSGIISMDTLVTSGSSSANGTIGGELMGYEINRDAEVIATFTNGMQSSVGKIALFHFQNNQGLERISGSRFMESSNSGKPLFFKDENGQNILGANVSNFKLENSNVRIEVGLTELIILQRAFDANSKSISTSDQMMQKALNMDAK